MYGLTEQQIKILAFLKAFQAKLGYPPTRAEMAKTFKWKSHNTAQCHLEALAAKKRIRIIPGISRGIQILK